MHNHCLTLFMALMISGATQAAKVVLPFKTDVVADGFNKEWDAHLPNYDKTTGINYSIANDAKNLYFIIRVTDVATQKQIMKNGLEVWINKEGKKKKTTGISFPLPMEKPKNAKNGQKQSGSPTEQGMQSQDMQGFQSGENGQASSPDDQTRKQGQRPEQMPGQNMSFPARELTLTGFLIDNGKQPVKGCPVHVAISRDESSCMTYELTVPFNTFFKEQLEKSDKDLPFCFGFLIKGTDEGNQTGGFGMGGPGMGGPGMGGPGMDGGGMGGPGMSMGGQRNSSATANTVLEEKKCWIKATLNVN